LKSLDNFFVDLFSKKYYINIMRKAVKNISAKALADRKFHQRIVTARKGKGSYNRKHLEKRYA
jgi:stalled ribosome alternative rescue factor ArfA